MPSQAGKVRARFTFERDGIVALHYRWDSKWKILGIPAEMTRGPFIREHKLWKSTCFEAFIKPRHENKYWEINLTPLHRWNAYAFDGYRKPSPPREVSKWKLLEMNCQGNHLAAKLRTDLGSQQEFQIGLSCIFESTGGEKTYWALQHNRNDKPQPDFHDAKHFLLERISL